MRAYVGLGSNLGDPAAQFRAARIAMAGLPDTRLRALSPVYRSAPMGPADQPEFLNAVVALDTRLSPLELLDELQSIEAIRGRVRSRHWGPRTLDLDLLLYGEQLLTHPRLQLPHPGVHQRGFVLYPLADIAPDAHIPGHGLVRDLINTLPAEQLLRVHDFCWSERI
ncbi:MAG: 2-amino-4-hydroxy-6-hydroxymethyldihydropteridine diphosphokinase [Aquisalimonadaceae bacterium]